MRRLLILFISVWVLSLVVQAQDTPITDPIIALSKGDIYAIDPVDLSIRQLTHHPAVFGDSYPYAQRDVTISPDGHYLAYQQTPRFFQIAMKNNLTGNLGDTPSDIVILNLETGEEKLSPSSRPT